MKKDFLEVRSELHGKDWKGDKIPPVIDYIEGYHYEPEFTTTTKQDFETGDLIPYKEYRGNNQIHDIELTDKTRKQVIEDIINNAAGTYIEEIKFYYQVPSSVKGASFRCDLFTYDQFINSSLDELENLARTTPSPIRYSIKDKKDYMG